MDPRLPGLVVTLLLLLHSASGATEHGAISFTTRLYFYASGAGDEVIGWEFVPRTDLAVTKLGLYDGRPSGGFSEQHVIAIWDDSAQMIGSAPIPMGEAAPLDGSFRFVDVAGIQLSAGQHYVIGAFMPAPVSDYFRDFLPGDSQVQVDPMIDFVAMRVGASPGGLTFPQLRYPDHLGLFGPNFAFTEVPEPAVVKLGFVAVLLAWAARRLWRAPRIL